MTGSSCNRSTAIKYMLPKYRHLQSTWGLKKNPPEHRYHPILQKALGGLRKIPPSTAIAYAILQKALGGLRKIPPEHRYRLRDLTQKTLGGLRKIPPSTAI